MNVFSLTLHATLHSSRNKRRALSYIIYIISNHDIHTHRFSLLENEIYTAEQNRKSRSESGSGSGYDPQSGSGSRSGSGPGSFSSNSLPRLKLSSIEVSYSCVISLSAILLSCRHNDN